VTVVALDAGWDDVGGWDAVLDLAARGEAGPARVTVARGSAPGSVVLTLDGEPPRGAIALGDEPLLVVSGPEGWLVTPRDRADEVKGHL
jgi:mannose-1-phosphate guanylyltransferase